MREDQGESQAPGTTPELEAMRDEMVLRVKRRVRQLREAAAQAALRKARQELLRLKAQGTVPGAVGPRINPSFSDQINAFAARQSAVREGVILAVPGGFFSIGHPDLVEGFHPIDLGTT